MNERKFNKLDLLSIKPCSICGGFPAFTKERYSELYGFNHTCKGISPNIHINSNGYPSIEMANAVWNEKIDKMVVLPCDIGSIVYEPYRFCGDGAWEIAEHRIMLEDIPKIGKTVFLTREEAEEMIRNV